MKFRIEQNIDALSLKDCVPTEYRSLAITCEAQLSEACTLIVFPHNRKDVVKSWLVEKALKRLKGNEPESLVAVVGYFSLESVALLKAKNTIFLNLSEFPWTDEGHITIRSGGTR